MPRRIQFGLRTLLLAIGIIAAICATWRVIPYWPPVLLGWLGAIVWSYGLVSFRPARSNVAATASMFIGIGLFIVAAVAFLVCYVADLSVGAFIA